MNGFFLIDKPSRSTSHDVVAAVRRILGQKKVGHAGTLDPMATGLLVLAAGRFTRLIRYVQDLGKEYVATVRFGIATDTLDADGAVLSREPMPFEQEELEAVLPRFTGLLHQVPPMVSALKVGGRRLYDIARSGEVVEREARPVRIDTLELVDFQPGAYPEAVIRVRCGKGTYIRSLADDIGRAMGGHASLGALRRTAIGSLAVDDAVTLEELADVTDPWAAACAPRTVLAHMATVEVDEATAAGISNGVRILVSALGTPVPDGPIALVSQADTLLAVYRVEGRQAVPEVVVA